MVYTKPLVDCTPPLNTNKHRIKQMIATLFVYISDWALSPLMFCLLYIAFIWTNEVN